MPFAPNPGGGLLLIAGAILLLAVLLMEHRLSRISRKLDKTNSHLEQTNQLLASQVRLLEAISNTTRRSGYYDASASAGSERRDSVRADNPGGDAGVRPRAHGPNEL